MNFEWKINWEKVKKISWLLTTMLILWFIVFLFTNNVTESLLLVLIYLIVKEVAKKILMFLWDKIRERND